MRRIRTKYPADRLSPLKQWLLSQVGRPWNKVWEEVCAVNDNRSMDGWHFREHVLGIVNNNGVSREGSNLFSILSSQFWVDNKGFLRHKPYKKWQTPVQKADKFSKVVNGKEYILTEHGWFRSINTVKSFYGYVSFIGGPDAAVQKPPNFLPIQDEYYVRMWREQTVWKLRPYSFIKRNQNKIQFVAHNYHKCDKNELRSIR